MDNDRMRFLLCVAVLSVATAGCSQKPKVPVRTAQPGAPTVESARQFLQGRWSLISYEVFPPGRPSIQITQGSGSLVYDAFGNLQMEVRVTDPMIAENLERAGIPLANGLISTSGRTAIDLEAKTLTYFLQGEPPLLTSRPGGPLAFSRPRHYELKGDVLTLTTRGDDGKPASVSRWQKAE
jgi:hypothetical protein